MSADETLIVAEEVALVPVTIFANPADSLIHLVVEAQDGQRWRFQIDGIQAADLAADALRKCGAVIAPHNA